MKNNQKKNHWLNVKNIIIIGSLVLCASIIGVFLMPGKSSATVQTCPIQFQDNFGAYTGGNVITSPWSQQNGVTVENVGGSHGKVAKLNSSGSNDEERMWVTINTNNYTNLKLEYDRKTEGLESDQQDLFTVKYKADGGSWQVLYDTKNNRDWDHKSHNLPEANEIIISFGLLGTHENDIAYVDNVVLYGCQKPAVIYGHKVVCDSEYFLPDWGVLDGNKPAGAPSQITGSTAQEWVDQSDNHCWIDNQWVFQWTYASNRPNPDNNQESYGAPWQSFTTVDPLKITNIQESQIWLREQPATSWVPFTGVTDTSTPETSAEFYCGVDILNYDNYEWIGDKTLPLVAGGEYHCVGFNTQKEAGCGNEIVEPGEQCDGGDGCTDKCIQTGSINGYKYNDLNGNGAHNQPAGEPQLDGFNIFVDSNNNGIFDSGEYSQVTYFDEPNNTHGQFHIKNLPLGTHVVCEEQKEGWQQTQPVDGNGDPICEPVTLTLENPSNSVVFGNQEIPTYDLMGFKWNDLNGNRERDCEFSDRLPTDFNPEACEPLLPGWTIQLKKDGEIIKTDVTSDNVNGLYGGYYFDGLLAGTYEICEVLQDGWSQTFPESPVCHTVTLPLSQEGDTCSSNMTIIGPLTSISEQEPLPRCNFGNRELFCGDLKKNQESEQCDGTDGVGPYQTCNNDCMLESVIGCFPNFLETNQPNFVDLSDFSFFSNCYGSQTGDANYLDICDVNDDGFVNDYDANVFANHYNKPFTCGQDPIIYPLCGNAIVEGTEQCDGNKVECQKVVGDVVYNGYKYCDNYGQTTALTLNALEKIEEIKVNSCVWTTDECQTLCGDGFINQATETCDDGNVVSGDGCSDICVTEVPPLTPEVPKIEPVKAPILTIAKSVESGTYYPGDKVNYIITIKNTGTDIAYNVRLADTMAAGFIYDDASEGSWFFSDLKVGQEMNHIYTMTIGTSVVPGTYTNTAQVSADKVAPVKATADLVVVAKPGVVLGAETEGAVAAAEEETLPAAGSSIVSYLIVLVGLSGLAIILKK